ncbi:MAG: M14 family metallopeptidase [Longimicrobiales bacterium]|nr:M14 family metallopeptidase [Longimicrobiales bacterium]
MSTHSRAIALAALAFLCLPTLVLAQGSITEPVKFFGHQIGADYVLPTYQQLVAYWQQLEAESDRLTVVDIGKTAEGRTQYMAIVTSPENHRNLERYRQIAGRLATAEGLDDAEARRLAAEGKAVVWIDGGLHASEVLGAQQLIEISHRLVSGTDPETRRILDDVIVLLVQANPDGMELVSNWYMREPEPTRRTFMTVPTLYQKYIGHDNNRDFYASTQPETENMNRVLYHTWFPQVLYNHHQTGPMGQVMFAPPFRDPYPPTLHPMVRTGIELFGAAMHGRFIAENKPGVGTREGAGYSTWFNGGLRTMTYFHNMIGLLTETKGNPTPDVTEGRSDIPLIPRLQLPSKNLPFPLTPQRWSFRSSVEYSITADYAVLDAASRYRETLLFNRYAMGRDAIARGSRDSWTVTSRLLDSLAADMERSQARGSYEFAASCDRVRTGMPLALQRPCMGADEAQAFFEKHLRNRALRDARGYILPADQPDFPTAVKFANALIEAGITVSRATTDFTVNGKPYPKGSLVVRTAQPFRPHILDMFEPQDHPNDFEYPGGPPIYPYDAAGWTLAYQMGVRFDRVFDGFDGPFETITEWNARPPAGTVEAGAARGYLLSPAVNDAFRAVSRLLTAGREVHRLSSAWDQGGRRFDAGTFFVPEGRGVRASLEASAAALGVNVSAAAVRPNVPLARIRQPRIALWDEYGGSMPSGWTRWIMEQFEIPFKVVYAPELDAGNLRDKYDVIIFVDGAIPARDGGAAGPDPSRIPAENRHMLGRVTVATTVPQLRAFLEEGGKVVTIGHSTALARHLGLPVRDHLIQRTPEGEKALTGEQYFVPASVLRVRVDNTQPLAYGMPEQVDVLFDESPVLGFDPGAPGLQRVAWFDTKTPLRSGWAWGQHYLEGGIAAAEARVGDGTLFLFGPEILFRSQPHGTYKFFLNALYNPAP